MTTSAREVLEDCRGALAELGDGVQGPVWRRRWIVAVVLLRAVGHVLDKVDGARSKELKEAVDEWWCLLRSTKPKPQIFWQFVDEERNAIVKEYQTNARQGVSIQVPVIEINLRIGEQTSDPAKPPTYRYTMNAGHFKDRDQRELIAEAIQWWEGELAAIDQAVKQAAP